MILIFLLTSGIIRRYIVIIIIIIIIIMSKGITFQETEGLISQTRPWESHISYCVLGFIVH
jgi:hypothetical protein